MIELEDGHHVGALEGWRAVTSGFGLSRRAAGQVHVDGRPVPEEVIVLTGYVFAYLEREWHFTIGAHSGVVKQGVAGVPIWDLLVDGRRIPHAPMARRRLVETVAQLLLALAVSVCVVTLIILLIMRVLLQLGAPR